MLFNSTEFLFLFLPAVLGGSIVVGKVAPRMLLTFLAAMSLIFYMSWSVAALPLLIGSVIFNYVVGKAILQSDSPGLRRAWLTFGVATDLAVLAYFKYAGFFLDLVPVSRQWHFHVILPIGISFFTFTQIAFLVDAAGRRVTVLTPTSYSLFVTYFPHLVAGPILHHAQMMPQFGRMLARPPVTWDTLQVGVGLFLIGLFKKTFVADQLSPLVAQAFDQQLALSWSSAWTATLSYSMQIYYDFSGYSDMACGLSWMLGIRLPINFNSPYKATSIVDFWRCWHITLSIFLRDYLYIPLGGNRHGTIRRYGNLMITMLLGGLWHGAGWTFVLWGGLHGMYLIINHTWRAAGPWPAWPRWLANSASWMLTFVAVAVAWVFFRARNIEDAVRLLSGMAGLVHAPRIYSLLDTSRPLAFLAAALLLPNTVDLFGNSGALLIPKKTLSHWSLLSLSWRSSLGWALTCGLVGGMGLLAMGGTTEFLYFRF